MAVGYSLADTVSSYVLFTSVANNTKIYFGEKIPTIFSDMLSGAAALTNLGTSAPLKQEPVVTPPAGKK